MKRVSMDDLREYFPETDEAALMEQAKAEGIEVEGIKEEPVEKEEPAEEVKEETEEEPAKEEEETDNDDDLVDERTKKGLIAARQKEREKRRAVEAEKNAEIARLNKQLEELTKQRVAPIQQAVVAQQPQPEQQGYYDKLMDKASEQARKESGIDKTVTDEDIATLQFTEPRKYQKYILAMSTIAQDMHRANLTMQQTYAENDAFGREVFSDPQSQAILNYANSLLDEMPRREAKKIDDAAFALGQHSATSEQLATLREYLGKAKAAFNEARQPVQPRVQQPAIQQPSKLDNFAKQPRSQEVRGSQSSTMSEADLLRMFDDDPEGALDKVPKAILDRYRRG